MKYKFLKKFMDYEAGREEEFIRGDNGFKISRFDTEVLLATNIIEEAEDGPWVPVEGGEFWYIHCDGDVLESTFDNTSVDRKISSFLGVYRTREEAEAMRDKVREYVKGLNKN